MAALAQNNTNAPASIFQANEVGLTLGVAVDPAPPCGNTTELGGVVGVVAYPLQKYVGVEVSTILGNTTVGSTFNNVSVNLIARLPIEKLRLAPYAIGGYRYAEVDYGCFYPNHKDVWAVGGGVEYRIKPRVGLFADYQRLFNASADTDQFRAGLRWTF